MAAAPSTYRPYNRLELRFPDGTNLTKTDHRDHQKTGSIRPLVLDLEEGITLDEAWEIQRHIWPLPTVTLVIENVRQD